MPDTFQNIENTFQNIEKTLPNTFQNMEQKITRRMYVLKKIFKKLNRGTRKQDFSYAGQSPKCSDFPLFYIEQFLGGFAHCYKKFPNTFQNMEQKNNTSNVCY